MSSHDDDGSDSRKREVPQFEPIPHDHDFCERVVINVSRKMMMMMIPNERIVLITMISTHIVRKLYQAFVVQ